MSARLALIATSVALVALLAACGGSTHATPTAAPIVLESPTVASPTAGSTATAAATATPTAVPASPTATHVPATATPTHAPASPTRRASPAVTPSPTAVPTGPLGDVRQLDPIALPNYTVKMTFDGQNLPASTAGAASAKIGLEIEQNSPANYHMRLSSDDTHVEAWKVDGKSYFAQDNQITEVPADSGTELFTPTMFLQSVPELPASLGVQKLGTETISGRAATHYRVPPENLGAFLSNGDAHAAKLTNPTGGLDLWIDQDLNILLKANSDATWTNADNSVGSLVYSYSIDAVGSTPVVTAPQ